MFNNHVQKTFQTFIAFNVLRVHNVKILNALLILKSFGLAEKLGLFLSAFQIF